MENAKNIYPKIYWKKNLQRCKNINRNGTLNKPVTIIFIFILKFKYKK